MMENQLSVRVSEDRASKLRINYNFYKYEKGSLQYQKRWWLAQLLKCLYKKFQTKYKNSCYCKYCGKYLENIWPSLCLLAVLGLQGIVTKCTATIFLVQSKWCYIIFVKWCWWPCPLCKSHNTFLLSRLHFPGFIDSKCCSSLQPINC